MSRCTHVLHAATYVDPEPAETCDRDVVDGTDYCPEHLGMTDLLGPDPDGDYDRLRDARIGL